MMKYRELLELYSKNQLDSIQKKQIEADIEKQEAISEFLFERDEKAAAAMMEEPGIQEREQIENSGMAGDGIQPDFVRMINRSIRRAFIKMGAAAAAAAVFIVLFVIVFLPKVMDLFYYDPGASIGEHGNQMSLDLSVYTQLWVPGYQRNAVAVTDRGYGNYDILIPQEFSYHDTMVHLSGRISKGNLTLYDPNLLNPMTGNAFAWFQIKGDSSDSLTELIDQNHQKNTCAAGNREYALKTVENLDENINYMAYVTLDHMMPYETFITYLEQSDRKKKLESTWCAVCTENGIAVESGIGAKQGASLEKAVFQAGNLGFYCELSPSALLDFDREKYPYLVLLDQTDASGGLSEPQEEAMKKEAIAKIHFTSMLRYMGDQEKFIKMMGAGYDKNDYMKAADYVEKNGLMVYGFAGIGKKETLQELFHDKQVYEIYTQKLK